MRTLPCRLLVVAAVAVGTVVIVRRRSHAGRELLPVIGGDTWPPVPVKDVRPA